MSACLQVLGILSEALHSAPDLVAAVITWFSAVVLFSLICANFGFFFADSVAALLVAKMSNVDAFPEVQQYK